MAAVAWTGHGVSISSQETTATLEATSDIASPAMSVALKVARLLGELETYVCGQSDIIIDYATARRREEPISTAVTESTVQWLDSPPDERPAPADALDATARCGALQGSMRGDERYSRARSRRRRGERPSPVSPRGMTPQI